MKRIFSLALCLLLLFSLAACGSEEEVQTEDIKAQAQTLTQDAINFCGKIYGAAGVSAAVTEQNENEKYIPADSDKITVETLRQTALQYFTEEIAEKELFPEAFGGSDPMYIEKDGRVYVNSEKLLPYWRTEWQFDTAVVTERTETAATLRMKVVRNDSESGTGTLKLKKNAAGQWRLDCIVY